MHYYIRKMPTTLRIKHEQVYFFTDAILHAVTIQIISQKRYDKKKISQFLTIRNYDFYLCLYYECVVQDWYVCAFHLMKQ